MLSEMFTTHDPDVNYTISPAVAVIECNLAIMTACTPTLWPLARHFKGLSSSANTSSVPFKCTHCQCGKHQYTGYISRSSTRNSGSKLHYKPSISNMESLRKDGNMSAMSTRTGLKDMNSFKTSNFSTIMSVSQGLRETRNADTVLEPDIERKFPRGRCTWPDAASPGIYEEGVLIMELNRIFDREPEKTSC